MRKKIYTDNFYHIYNRGTEKRKVFMDQEDFYYFLKLLKLFNTKKAFGRFKSYKNIKNSPAPEKDKKPIVKILAYCLNENHYHLILKQIDTNGISKFMQKIITAYTMYFNKKYNRTGPLFSGKFKYKNISSQSYLDYVGVYVNLNFVIHKPKLQSFRLHTPPKEEQRYISSWDEYMEKTDLKICNKNYLLSGFNSKEKYRQFAGDKLEGIIENRKKELEQ